MPGRNRRVRLLAFVVFAALVFLLYSRSGPAVEGYKDYVKDKAIGGGAVMRPKPEEDDWVRPSTVPEPEQAKDEADLFKPPPPQSSSESPPTITPTKVFEASSTTTTPTPATTSDPSVQQPPHNQPPPPPPSEDEFPHQVGEGRVEVDLNASPSANIIRWTKQPEHFPISTTTQLPSGTSKPFPRIQRAVDKLSANGVDQERLAIVKATAKRAWKGYREFAFPQDEIRPISGAANNPFNGWGATMVDSLDTLWIMGMREEFEEAVEAVDNIDFATSPRADIPLFETVIRYLGGLVAAFDVSGRNYLVLLEKAVELAEILYGAFDTPNRVPLTYYRWKPSFASQPHRASNRVVLAEIGTLSMEFTRLAQITKEPKYYDAIARLTDLFDEWQNSTRIPGMWPTSFDASGCGKPVQVQSTETQNQRPVPEQQNAPGVAVTEEDKKQNLDDVRKPQDEGTIGGPGIAKGGIKGFGDPIEEGSIDDKDIKAKLLNSPNPNRKRQEYPGARHEREAGKEKSTAESGENDKLLPPTMENLKLDDMCVPQGFRSSSKNTPETYTLSGASDSMYEYLPKQYLLLGGQVEQYKDMYLASAATAIEKLLYKPMTEDERDILMTGQLSIVANYSQPVEERGYIEKFQYEAAHLACFAGGMFAMGGVLFDKPEHVTIGSQLTDGCVWAYNVTATGVMPEGAHLMPCPETWGECAWNETAYWEVLDPYEHTRTNPQQPVMNPNPGSPLQRVKPEASVDLNKRQLEETSSDDSSLEEPQPPAPAPAPAAAEPSTTTSTSEPAVYTPPAPLSHADFVHKKISDERLPPGYVRIGSRKYILRPEAIESVFYMYRITGDTYWREVGWDMFTAIDRHTRAPHGNSAIDDITKAAPELLDQMESFWLAETLKYFYLLFDGPERWSLDEWVLNTEAHLFRRPGFEFVEG